MMTFAPQNIFLSSIAHDGLFVFGTVTVEQLLQFPLKRLECGPLLRVTMPTSMERKIRPAFF
jgi:hypothetical protein